jgi:hypothetical protein
LNLIAKNITLCLFVTTLFLPVVSAEVKFSTFIKNPWEERIFFSPKISWVGDNLVIAVYRANETKLFALRSIKNTFKKNLQTIDMVGGRVSAMVEINQNILALGLPEAASHSKKNLDGLKIMRSGTAEWSQGASISSAGKVVLLGLQEEIIKLREISSPMPQAWGKFGYSIDTNGFFLAIGAPTRSIGKTYLYNLNEKKDDAQFIDSVEGPPTFGTSVALINNFLVIGSPKSPCCESSIEIYTINGRQLKANSNKHIENPDKSTYINYGKYLFTLESNLIVAGGGVYFGDGFADAGGLDVYSFNNSVEQHLRLSPGVLDRKVFLNNPSLLSEDNKALWLLDTDYADNNEVIKFFKKHNDWSASRFSLNKKISKKASIAAKGSFLAIVEPKLENKVLVGWQVSIHEFL